MAELCKDIENAAQVRMRYRLGSHTHLAHSVCNSYQLCITSLTISVQLLKTIPAFWQVDLGRASELIDEKLVPVHQQYGIDLSLVGH